jgi:hypothetical protein
MKRKKPEPKAEKMWAVVNRFGNVIYNSVSDTRRGSIRAVTNGKANTISDALWENYADLVGYRCVRVEVRICE